MYKIVFSIPVHESPESVIDQIVNYNTFNDNCAIVLHMSKTFSYKDSSYTEDSFMSALDSFGNVFINPNHLRTGYADIIQTHMSNFQHACNVTDFEYFSIGASNDLFVRKGLYEFISDYDAGFSRKHKYTDKEWMWNPQLTTDHVIDSLLEKYQTIPANVIICQIEGCFYKKDLFSKIIDDINEFYDFEDYDFKGKDRDKVYPREEVYFSTVAEIMSKSYKIYYDSYAYVAFEIRISHIPLVSSIRKYAAKDSHIFNVKRFNRKLNDPFRAYVRDNIGHYYDQVRQYNPGTKKCNYIHLYAWNACVYLNNTAIAYTMRRAGRKILRLDKKGR